MLKNIIIRSNILKYFFSYSVISGNIKINYNNQFLFSKFVASKPKAIKNKYEESENALNDIIAIFEQSDEEGVFLNEKDASDNESIDKGSSKDKINYHFIEEKDPGKAALNLQNFIMKSSEKLSTKNLREFLHYAESFKAQSSSPEYRQHKIMKNRLFLKRCFKIFEKDKAGDLIYLLMICDIMRISHENFSSTVFNFDEEMELKNKITKFNDFNYSQIPKTKPLVNDLEAKHKRLTNLEHLHTEDQSDLNLLSKISKIKFENDLTHLQFKENTPSKEKTDNFVNDLEENEELDNDKSRNKADKMILDIVNKEIENNLTSNLNYANEIKEDILKNQDINQKPIDFDRSFAVGDYYIEKMKNYLRETAPMKPDVRLQQPKEILILQQKNFSKHNIIQTNWVYVSGLPYMIEDPSFWENHIRTKFELFAGKVKNIKIFAYSDFLSVKQNDQITYSLSPKENIENIFLPFQNNDKSSKNINNNIETLDQDQDKDGKTMPSIGDILKNLNINIEIKSNEKMDVASSNRKSKKTEKILSNIKEKTSKKLERSYALVEFADYTSKQKALIPEMRVFGMKIEKNMCITDDADYKLTLICNNVHWGASLEKFCDKINEQFEKNHTLDLKVEINPEDSKKIITKYFLLIRFNNFPNTVKALYSLKEAIFENRLLRFNHLYGSLKKFKTKYYEILDSDSLNEIVGKIEENKIFEISKIAQSKFNDEPEMALNHEVTDLLFEEGMNPSLDNEEDYPPFFLHNHPDEEAIEDKYQRYTEKYAEYEEIERLERERFH